MNRDCPSAAAAAVVPTAQTAPSAQSAPTAATPDAPVPRAIVLAAGRGERMRPLSDHCPKPLLPVRGQPMIVWHLQALAAAGVREVVVNTAWLEAQFPAALGDGSAWGLRLHYSMEGRDHGGALETAGGIATALPWLGPLFWVVSGDIVAPGLRFDPALAQAFAASDDDAWLWLVPNPDYHPAGDFALDAASTDPATGIARLRRPPDGQPRPLTHTYANVALMRARLVAGVRPGQRAALGPLLFASAQAGRLGGRLLDGPWHNVGTPAQLAALNTPQPLADAAPAAGR